MSCTLVAFQMQCGRYAANRHRYRRHTGNRLDATHTDHVAHYVPWLGSHTTDCPRPLQAIAIESIDCPFGAQRSFDGGQSVAKRSNEQIKLGTNNSIVVGVAAQFHRARSRI